MVDQVVIPKKILLRQIQMFIRNKQRGISLKMFADLCGVSYKTIQYVFLWEEMPMTELIQRRVSKGFRAYQRGEIAVFENKDRTRYYEYRKEPKPPLQRSLGVQLVDGQMKLKIGIKNKHDYSELTLDEQLKKG